MYHRYVQMETRQRELRDRIALIRSRPSPMRRRLRALIARA